MRRCLFALGLMCWTLPSWALTEIQSLEKRLIVEGESIELIGALTMEYAMAGDLSSAQAYWQYWQSMVAALPETQQAQWLDLQAQIQQVLQRSSKQMKSAASSLQSLTLIGTGFDSNANRGTNDSEFDLNFDSGETLVLRIDDEVQSSPSAFASVRWLAVQPTQWQGMRLNHGVEYTHYTSQKVNSYSLLRTGIEFEHGGVTAFHYEHNDSVTGLLASMNWEALRGAFRYQTDRAVVQLGLQHRWVGNRQSHSLYLGGEYDDARVFRSGGNAQRVRMQYQFQQQNWLLGYRVEYSKDADTYNALLFPGVKDRYLWQTLSAERALGRYGSMNFGLRFKYDRKDARIDLNDWNSFSLELIAWI